MIANLLTSLVIAFKITFTLFVDYIICNWIFSYITVDCIFDFIIISYKCEILKYGLYTWLHTHWLRISLHHFWLHIDIKTERITLDIIFKPTLYKNQMYFFHTTLWGKYKGALPFVLCGGSPVGIFHNICNYLTEHEAFLCVR